MSTGSKIEQKTLGSTVELKQSLVPADVFVDMAPDEWELPSPEIPVRQGDFLIKRNSVTRQVETMCLIITADCDISQEKFGTHLACLRVISFQEYLERVWAGKKLNRAMEKEGKAIRDQLDKWNRMRLGETSSLSLEAVRDWITASEPEVICRDLGIPQSSVPKISPQLRRFRAALVALIDNRQSNQLFQLLSFRVALTGKDREECLQEILEQAQGAELPEDVFFFPTLAGMSIGPGIAMLREIMPLPLDSICFRTSDTRLSGLFLRVGRLKPIYKYAVSQAFGNLYSRIGLPKEYEDRRSIALGKLVNINQTKPCVQSR